MAKLERPTRRICVRIWEEDAQELDRMTTADMNFNEILRNALHEFVRHHRDRMRRRLDEIARANAGADAGAES